MKTVAEQMRALLHLSNEDIAQRLGCSTNLVQRRRREINPGMAKQGADWTEEAKKYVYDRAEAGDTAAVIASQVWEHFRIRKSRNAVIGIVNRAGKSVGGGAATANRTLAKRQGRQRAAQIKRLGAGRPSVSPAQHYANQPIPEDPGTARVSFDGLQDHHCRAIPGDPRQPQHVPMYCGLEKVPGLAYCELHARRYYQASQPYVRIGKVWVRRGKDAHLEPV